MVWLVGASPQQDDVKKLLSNYTKSEVSGAKVALPRCRAPQSLRNGSIRNCTMNLRNCNNQALEHRLTDQPDSSTELAATATVTRGVSCIDIEALQTLSDGK